MTDKDNARQQITALVEKFASDHQRYTSPQYNETEVRIQFVNPFFEALGWDMADSSGRHEVFHEDYVEVEEEGRRRSKRPDYGFRFNNQTRFFVETKKPSVNLKANPDPAFQVRRYGWSARLPVSILTDFEEFIVYDCRLQPSRDDLPTKGRLRYYNYTDYADKWDEIYDLFSYDAVANNRLEAWIQETKQRGTVTVDDAFLNEMEEWRKMLAQDIALHNPNLSRRQLNMAVQVTIDRIVFLRICEDRGIEPYGRLEGFKTGEKVYGNLTALFRQADARYNSSLFHFKADEGHETPDTLTLNLNLSDDTLQHIISRLYYPSPYAFAVIPADILGQIYERFLGKVIELVPGKGAVVEEKPEVRKAGGVYYTPTYIVDYIVQNTVGKLVEGKTPDEVAKLKILDPACGSGSFLIGTYQYLLDWHLNYYTRHEAAKHIKGKRLRVVDPTPKSPPRFAERGLEEDMLSPPLKEGERLPQGGVTNALATQPSAAPLSTAWGGAGGGVAYTLTTAEKKRILLNNIYGVDLDQQAVEVTKLSLLLKVLEGETAATAQPELMAERVLPDLGDNIKWGNSLIGPDYYVGKQIPMFDEEELNRIRTFDWHSQDEGFGAIMAAGGFDAVIGNPPWVFTRDVSFGELAKTYFAQHYVGAEGKVNLYALFIWKGVGLLNSSGLFSMIIPNTFLRATTYSILREQLLRSYGFEKIIDTGAGVFKGVTASTVILLITKVTKTNQLRIFELGSEGISQEINSILHSQLLTNPNIVIDLYVDKFARPLIERMRRNCLPLSTYIKHLISGIQTWKQHKSNFIADTQLNNSYKPLLEGKDIGRYQLTFNSKYIWYNEEVLNVMQDESIFLSSEKILIQRVSGGDKPIKATLDVDRHYCFNSINSLVCENVDNRYILGILNSRLMNWFYSYTFSNRSTLTVNIANRNLEQLPIRTINFDDHADKVRHDRMVTLVETMLDLHQQLAAAPTEAAQKTIQSVIDSTDRQIDGLVYELYGLTTAEIALVEGN